MRELYPPIEPFDDGFLKVSDLHTVHYEQVGNPEGKKVVFLHGGPGGGLDADYRRYFDPARWHLVLFDQRGCGKSTPARGAAREHDLGPRRRHRAAARAPRHRQVARLRRELGQHARPRLRGDPPRALTGLILRGIFLLRRKELLWFYQEGASWLFPDAWDEYLKPIPEVERGDLMSAYYRRLTSPDPAVRSAAARAWSIWEGSDQQAPRRPRATSPTTAATRSPTPSRGSSPTTSCTARSCAATTQLLDDVPKIAHLPGVIVQGRYDVVCPAASAWALHKRWPRSKLVIVPDAGHSIKEPGILSALVQATDDFASL